MLAERKGLLMPPGCGPEKPCTWVAPEAVQAATTP